MPTTLSTMSLDPHDLDPATWLIAAGRPEGPGEALNHPVVATSSFEHGGERVYSRGEATEAWEALESVVGGLEGAYGIAYASGMAAVSAVFDQLRVGSAVVIPDDCYHGVSQVASAGEKLGRWTVISLPMDDTTRWVEARATADLVWAESPTNPMLIVGDLDAIGGATHPDYARFVVDNTFATALRQQPLDLGADAVMQSSTKFIGGHSDLLGGIVTTRSAAYADTLRAARTLAGSVPGTLETFLALRGVRTLAMRLATAEASASTIAARLGEHSAVSNVRYPGFGAMVSFVVTDAATADRVCQSLRVIRHATSLGGVESLIERRSRYSDTVPPGLLRLSVGCEGIEDLWADLAWALDQ